MCLGTFLYKTVPVTPTAENQGVKINILTPFFDSYNKSTTFFPLQHVYN